MLYKFRKFAVNNYEVYPGMEMNLEERLGERLGIRDIRGISGACVGESGRLLRAGVFALTGHPDDRVGYNALWVLTHLPVKELRAIISDRDRLVDLLLHAAHTGRRRLLLALLDRLPTGATEVRTDYLDFCLSRINSTEPYGVRALCMKQAFALCRFYPELMGELRNEIDMMEYGTLSPGLLCVRKHILRQMDA